MKIARKLILLVAAGALCTSCVTKKKYAELNNELDECYNSRKNISASLAANKQTLEDVEAKKAELEKAVDQLTKDTAELNRSLALVKSDLKSNKELSAKLGDQLKNSRSESEVKQLLAQMQSMQDKIQAREDSLAAREKQMQALASAIASRDSLMKSLKKKVSDALTNFEGKGISVITKKGKVYVSMDNQLLFVPGMWDLDKKGTEALGSISQFLAENKDIHVVVEGHTDNVPYVGKGQIKDNWDLSAKRATEVVRALIGKQDIDPARITASGRAEFEPLDPADTKEAKAKNRRTEIILSPNMDELMKIVNGD